MNERIIIVGSGQAGCQLAVSLRELGFDGEIMLIGDEQPTPYQRPPLSKAYLLGKLDAPGLCLKPAHYFEQKNIALRPGCRVTQIDRKRHQVQLDCGERLGYDHLVLATGARNRTLALPNATLDGIAMLRTLDDANHLRDCLTRVSDVTIIGAGFIGMEFAAVAAQLGRRVHVLERASRPLARAVSVPMAEHLMARHRYSGVTFEFGAQLQGFEGDSKGHVQAVQLADGRRIATELVLVGIGVVPNTHLAEEAGLTVADGIVVNEQLTTTDPAIHAIGDCACYPNVLIQQQITRLESVQNAVDQARCLARTLSGTPAVYTRTPWFWSDQWDMKLQIAGIGQPNDEWVMRGDPEQGRFSIFRFDRGRLSAVESLNHGADHMAARRLIEQRCPITPAQAQDITVPLKSLLAANAPA